MNIIKRQAAQGDVLFIKVDDIPDGLEKFDAENGVYIVAHSETGHNHVMVADRVQAYKKPNETEVNLYEMFLNVSGPTEVKHLRSFDTHESFILPEGNWRVIRQREYTPEGYRRAAD
jgi:hypothetical protein